MDWNQKKEVLGALGGVAKPAWFLIIGFPILVFRGMPALLEKNGAFSFSLQSFQAGVGPGLCCWLPAGAQHWAHAGGGATS